MHLTTIDMAITHHKGYLRYAMRLTRQEKQKLIQTHHTMSPMAYIGLNEVFQKKYRLFGDSGDHIAPERIAETVCEYFGVDRLDLNIKCNLRNLVNAKQICMYFISEMTSLKPKQISEMFKRDRTTFIYAKQTVQDLMDTDKNYKRQIEEIKELLNK